MISVYEQAPHTDFARSLRKPFRRAVKEFGLVKAGDRIAVCISGGKDSLVLALLMKDLARETAVSLRFLAMDPGYTKEHRAHIEENAKKLGLDLDFFETNVLTVAGNHAPDHPCFLCAKMRRGHLYTEAAKLGCNKIALGHHFDDAIETVLMGVIYGGQVQTMLPRLKSANYDGMELIRPLYFVRERDVAAWGEQMGLVFESCGCPAARRETDTKRGEIKALIARLAAENPQIEQNILNAVKSVDTRKILGWKDENGHHSFLDQFDK